MPTFGYRTLQDGVPSPYKIRLEPISDGVNSVYHVVHLVSDATGTVITPANPANMADIKLSTARNIGLLASTGLVIKNSPGVLYEFMAHSTAQCVVDTYIKFYDSASVPTLGSGTPIRTFRVKAGEDLMWNLTNGALFATGICVRVTTGLADNDTGTVAVGDIVFGASYK